LQLSVVWDLIKEKVGVLIKPIRDVCRTHARAYARTLVYTRALRYQEI